MERLLSKHWHHLPSAEIFKILESNSQIGLDIFEIKKRQDRYGVNVLTPQKPTRLIKLFIQQFNHPLVYILLVAELLIRSIFTRIFFSNKWLIFGSIAMILLQIMFTYLPIMNHFFSSAPIGFTAWVLIILASFIIFSIVVLEKYSRQKQLVNLTKIDTV